MGMPGVYADFQKLDDLNRLRLTCAGTLQHLERRGIQLHEGLLLTLSTDDEDDQGRPDVLRADGVAHYDTEGQCWLAAIGWAAVRDASAERAGDIGEPEASAAAPLSF